MQHGGAFPDVYVAVFRPRNASLRNRGKFLVIASTRASVSIMEIAQQISRIFVPPGGAGGKDTPSVASGKSDASPSMDWGSHESAQARRKSKKNLEEWPNQAGGRWSVINPKTRRRNRRFLRNS